MWAIDVTTDTYKGDLRIIQSRQVGNEVAAILFFHGGGWWGGNFDVFLSYWIHLLEYPLQCFSAEYRVGSRCVCTVYDAIEDANSAARYVTDRIGALPFFLAGASAGGTLALLASIKAQATGVICFNPVLDLSADGFVNARTPKGGDVSISPLHLLRSKRFPPILILQGEQDKTTPLRTAKEFAETAANSGQSVELACFSDRDHGFFNMGEIGRKETAPLVWRFVQSHLTG